MDNGIVSFADKREYIESAVALSVTAKKFNRLPVCLITTKDAMPIAVEFQDYFDKILVLDNAATDFIFGLVLINEELIIIFDTPVAIALLLELEL